MQTTASAATGASAPPSASFKTLPFELIRDLERRAARARLPGCAHRVLHALISRADGKGFCFPGQRDLAERSGLCERSVRNGIVALEKAQFLTRQVPSHAARAERQGATTLYQIQIVDPTALCRKAPATHAEASKRKIPFSTEAPAKEHRQALPPKEPIKEINTHVPAPAHARACDPSAPAYTPVPAPVPEPVAPAVPSAVPPTQTETPADPVPMATLGAANLALYACATRRERSIANRAAHAQRREAEYHARLAAQKPVYRPERAQRSSPHPSVPNTPARSLSVAPQRSLLDLPPDERTQLTASLREWRLNGFRGSWTYNWDRCFKP